MGWGVGGCNFLLRKRGIPTLPKGMVQDMLFPPPFRLVTKGGKWWWKVNSSLRKWWKERENVSQMKEMETT